MPSPAKFDNHSAFSGLEAESAKLTDLLNPLSGIKPGQYPFYSTGARALIKCGGRPIGVCQNFHWTTSYQANPIVTIDTNIPWDIDVGPLTVSATLSQILDPTKGPEVDGLFSIMSASVHQPLIELQVLDKLGTSLFFARGMFLSVSGNIARGQTSTLSAQFTGMAYQHYVAQQFKAYSSLASGLSGLVNGLANIASSVTGGVL